MKKKIAIVGIRGIPAKYGGFETLVEQITKRLNKYYDFIVFCSSDEKKKIKDHNSSVLIYLPFKANGLQSVIYDSVSIVISIFMADKILILGSPGCLVLPFVVHKKTIFNYGGLDQFRSKWNKIAQGFISFTRYMGVIFSDVIIADNKGIQDFIKIKYGKESELIEYGGDQSCYIKANDLLCDKYTFLKSDYVVSIARIQKDNNVEMILDALEIAGSIKMVFIGNWMGSKYGKYLKEKYSNSKYLILLDAVYEIGVLNVLRSNAKCYIHGHSAGGTNPALVEAMFLKIPIFAYASVFNIYTTENKAVYFNDEKELADIIRNKKYLSYDVNEVYKVAQNRYRWEVIAEKYRKILN